MPPFAALLAFEAALRHGSMTLAAEELGLTQSAVSHRIRALEAFFGTALFERLNPGLRATEAGAKLIGELRPILGTLAGLRQRVLGQAGPRIFRIGLGGALLAWWLSPRLPALAEAFPDLTIEVLTWATAAEAARTEVDLALLWLPRAGGTAGRCTMAFPEERVFPVAAPKLLGADRPGQAWRDLPLLAKGRQGEETGPEWSWQAWLGPGRSAQEAMRFRDIEGALRAALDGNGVALGRSLLVADALRQRTLLRLVGADGTRTSTKVQIARWRDPADGTAARMAAWLVNAAVRAMAT